MCIVFYNNRTYKNFNLTFDFVNVLRDLAIKSYE